MLVDRLNELRNSLGNTKLMAVSKTRSLEEVKAVYGLGQHLFGENHVQEIQSKFDPSINPFALDVECEMIGHLQSNKVKAAVALASRIDSVDSLALAVKIDNEAKKIGKVMPILIELNTSAEDSKSGFTSENLALEAISEIARMENLTLQGFLTVGPVLCQVGTALWEKKTHQSFGRLREFKEKVEKLYPDLDLFELSMGMTADWKIGVQEGSTMVRIGTLIFGQRDYK